MGNLRNTGIEFSINTTPIQREGLNLDVNFNVTYNQNEITNLLKVPVPNDPGILVGAISGGTGNTVQVQTVGYPTNTFYLWRQVYNEAGVPLEGVYEDRNGDGQVTTDDLFRSQTANPQVFLGLTSQLTYGNFNAGFTLRGNFGNYIYNNVRSNTAAYRTFLPGAGYLGNGSPDVLTTNFAINQYFSDYYLENASFVRMDNFNLGYNFGKVFNNVAALRVSANVQNAFVITKYTGLDPEVAGGIDNNFYPRPRIFSLGLNLDF